MTYKINGTALTTQPTSGKWLPRTSLGISGSGQSVYSGVREFELRWQLVETADYNQLITVFNTIGLTGTISIDLPQFGASTYVFQTYSGCVLREPETGQYFSTAQQDVLLIVSNIRI